MILISKILELKADKLIHKQKKIKKIKKIKIKKIRKARKKKT